MNKPGKDPEFNAQMTAHVLAKIPLERFAQAGEIAKSVVHLCEETSGVIMGAELLIDEVMVRIIKMFFSTKMLMPAA